MRRRSSAWDRRKCETSYRWNRLRRSPSPLMACCWFPASLPSATPTTDSCLNPNGLPVPKVLGPQHNNSFINSALKSGAAVSVSKVSPASRPTCPLPRSPRNPLPLSLPPSATPIAETQMAKAEPRLQPRSLENPCTCLLRLLVRYIAERLAAAELPSAVLADQSVLIMAAQRHSRLLIRSRRHIRPARPGRGRVPMHIDEKVREQVIGRTGLAGCADALHHQRLDGRGAFNRSKAAHPLPVLSEKMRVGAEIWSVQRAAITPQNIADFLFVFEPLDLRRKRLVLLRVFLRV